MVNAAYGLAHLTQKIEVKAGEELQAISRNQKNSVAYTHPRYWVGLCP